MEAQQNTELLDRSLSKLIRDHEHQMTNMIEVVNTLSKRLRLLEGELACVVATINNQHSVNRPRLII